MCSMFASPAQRLDDARPAPYSQARNRTPLPWPSLEFSVFFKRIFTWWNGATFGVLFTIAKRGRFVGEDQFGNAITRRRRSATATPAAAAAG